VVVTAAEVRAALDGLFDPCSADGRVVATLCLTEPGCAMASWRVQRAHHRVARRPDGASVDLRLDADARWRESDMARAARERPAVVRARTAAGNRRS
jgi:metal-sulfur cluster biosynthetic enzyme